MCIYIYIHLVENKLICDMPQEDVTSFGFWARFGFCWCLIDNRPCPTQRVYLKLAGMCICIYIYTCMYFLYLYTRPSWTR